MFHDLQQFQTLVAEHIERLPQTCLQLLSKLLCRMYAMRRKRSTKRDFSRWLPEYRTTEFVAKWNKLCGTNSSPGFGI